MALRSGAEVAMLHAAKGLTEVGLADLKTALRLIHRAELATPLTVTELARCGLQHCAGPLLEQLRGLDPAGVRAVLICVIAERRERP